MDRLPVPRRAPLDSDELEPASNRQLPRLPVISDKTLVEALTKSTEDRAGHELPFGARLPSAAQLVAQALSGPPPLLLQEQYQQQVGQALSNLALAAGSVAAAASALSPNNAFNAFQQVGVVSSDPAVVTGIATAGSGSGRYKIVVEGVAAAQENLGQLLPADAPIALPAGDYKVELRTRIGGRTITVDIEDGDSHDLALNKFAAAVNHANLGVLAMLVRPTTGTVQIALTGNETGAGSAFSLTDYKGSLVRVSGAGHVVRPAHDVIYRLNGVRTISPTNVIVLGRGKVQLALHRAAPGVELTVNVGPDQLAVAGAVAHLIEALRLLRQIIRDNARYLSKAFASDCSALLERLQPAMSEVGISLDANGDPVLDRAEFAGVFDDRPGYAEQVIGSPNGLAPTIGRFAADIVSGPTSRLGAPEFVPAVSLSSGLVTPQQLLASHTLSALLYAQLFAQGLFINSLF